MLTRSRNGNAKPGTSVNGEEPVDGCLGSGAFARVPGRRASSSRARSRRLEPAVSAPSLISENGGTKGAAKPLRGAFLVERHQLSTRLDGAPCKAKILCSTGISEPGLDVGQYGA